MPRVPDFFINKKPSQNKSIMTETRHELVLLALNNTKNKWQFARVPNIENEKGIIQSIEVFPSEELSNIQGLTPIALANVKKGTLTLMQNNREVLREVPLAKFYPTNYNGRVTEVVLANVDWEKSYVEFGDKSTLPASGSEQLLVLSVIYTVKH